MKIVDGAPKLISSYPKSWTSRYFDLHYERLDPIVQRARLDHDLFGWTSGVVINPASIAAIAVAFATYLGFFVPLGPWEVKLVAVASIVALTALNCIGVKPGAITQNVLTLLKIGLVAVLIVVGFALPGGSVANFRPLWPDAGVGSLIGPFGVAMVAVLWAYDGWIEVCYVGGEVKNPERNLPRALVLSTLITIALFCLVTASYTYVLSPANMALSPRGPRVTWAARRSWRRRSSSRRWEPTTASC